MLSLAQSPVLRSHHALTPNLPKRKIKTVESESWVLRSSGVSVVKRADLVQGSFQEFRHLHKRRNQRPRPPCSSNEDRVPTSTKDEIETPSSLSPAHGKATPGSGSTDGPRETVPVPRNGLTNGTNSANGTKETNGTELSYWLITGLALVGAAETAYLTYEKLTGGSVACSVGGSCGGVLDSPWGTLLGLPLSLFGFLAYSTTAFLAQAARSSSDNERDPARWLLLATTAVMAGTSGYLMYILATELEGTSCPYCIGSAVLSASLLVATLKGFRRSELQKAVAAQAGAGLAAVLALSLAFADARSAIAGTGVIDIPFSSPEVSTVSTSPAVALARHLQSVGAKMYGAFWCSHCFEQKQMFGREAMQYVEYVECYPEGYRTGVSIATACAEANIQGFPTWLINGKALPGELDFEQLAAVSGFDTSTINK